MNSKLGGSSPRMGEGPEAPSSKSEIRRIRRRSRTIASASWSDCFSQWLRLSERRQKQRGRWGRGHEGGHGGGCRWLCRMMSACLPRSSQSAVLSVTVISLFLCFLLKSPLNVVIYWYFYVYENSIINSTKNPPKVHQKLIIWFISYAVSWKSLWFLFMVKLPIKSSNLMTWLSMLYFCVFLHGWLGKICTSLQLIKLK